MKDRIQRALEHKELIDFARNGGTPKGSPMCYGSIDKTKSKRELRHCGACRNELKEMCKAYGQFLKDLLERRTRIYADNKEFYKLETTLRKEGRLTSKELERMRFKTSRIKEDL